jgi:hypothetical protein
MSSGRIIKADGDGSALGPLSLPQVDRLGPPGLAALVGPAAGKFIAAEAGEHADTISAMLAVFPYLFPPETNNWSKAPMISPGSQLDCLSVMASGNAYACGVRGCSERTRCCEPPNRRRIHAVGPTNISLRLASVEPGQRLLPLEGRQLPRPAELHAAILSSLAALARSGPDQLSFELSQTAENRQH